MHYIYRDQVDALNPDLLVLIDSTDVTRTGLNYIDNGDFNEEPLIDTEEYCYYVQTKGGYGNPEIIEPLLNRSQSACGQPNDLIPPCTPISFQIDEAFECETYLQDKGCFFSDFSNKINWELNEESICQDDVRSFNIYFSSNGLLDFDLIDNVTTTEFTHEGLTSLKGCYRISAVDRSGNESPLSEMVCNDNCPRFNLPNVFTPNGDDRNELFTPYLDFVDGRGIPKNIELCPRFVESIDFKVFDRNGGEVYSYASGEGFSDSENGIYINWDGTSNLGVELASGVYFYSVEVTFDVLNPLNNSEVFSGWVHLLR